MGKPILRLRPPAYVPEWRGAFESYSHSWVVKQGWRVRHTVGGHEDAVQECAVVWAKCAARYTGTVDNAAWFMGLYKVALMRHWHTLSNTDTNSTERYLVSSTHEDGSTDEALFAEVGEEPAANLVLSLKNASAELKQLFLLVASAPAEVLTVVLAEADDATMARRICRWLGFTSGTDVIRELRELLAD